jgi:hypothetical protein
LSSYNENKYDYKLSLIADETIVATTLQHALETCDDPSQVQVVLVEASL